MSEQNTTPAAVDWFVANTPDIVAIDFSIGLHATAGTAPRHVHDLLLVDSKRLEGFAELLAAAGKGEKDPARKRALSRAALFAVWDELIVSVSGYNAELDQLAKADLQKYFRGDLLPANLDEVKRAQVIETMQMHVYSAVRGYLDRFSPEPSFRDRRPGGGASASAG